MDRRYSYATPTSPVDDAVVCRSFSIPEAYVSVIFGHLEQLTKPENWQQEGSDTPEEAADICRIALDDLLFTECETEPSVEEEIIWWLIEQYGDDIALWLLAAI